MRKDDLPRRLSFEDAAFVNFERPSMPMNVGSVAIFEGRVPFAGFQSHVERRIDEVPRYRQRLIPVPFGIAHFVFFFVGFLAVVFFGGVFLAGVLDFALHSS